MRVGVVVVVIALLSAVAYPCYLRIQAVRDRIRSEPRVSSSGLGCAGGYFFSIEGTGEPAAEVERRIAERVDDWVARESESLRQSCESIAHVSPGQRQSIGLSLNSPRLTPQILGRLDGFPRHECYSLSLSLDVAEFTPEGFAALAVLTNVDSLSLGPRVRGAIPERKRPYCPITEPNLAQVAKLNAIKGLAFTHVELKDAALRALNEMQNLTHLTLADVRIESAGLAHLGTLRNLKSLILLDMQIPETGLSSLSKLSNLEWLWIEQTSVSDANIASLSGLTKLACLHLDSVPITDVSLSHMEGLSNLQELSFYRTPVTDAGLPHLHNLSKLDWLCLRETQATPEGTARLKPSLPIVRIRD